MPKALPTGREKVEGHFLSRAQVDALAAKVAETDPVYGLLVRFAAGVGLRTSELAGLRLRDLRLARRDAAVERTAKNVPGTGWAFEEPRAPGAGDGFQYFMTSCCTTWASTSPPTRAAMNWTRPCGPVGLVAAATTARQALTTCGTHRRSTQRLPPGRGRRGPARRRTHWSPIPPPAAHLRHTCGSQWLADGHDMFSVSRWLGHSSIAFTDAVYAHVAQAPDYTAAIERTRRARGVWEPRRVADTHTACFALTYDVRDLIIGDDEL